MFKYLADLDPVARRRVRLIAALLMAVVLLVIAWQLLLVLVPLAVSAIIASLLLPVMRLGERLPAALQPARPVAYPPLPLQERKYCGRGF